MRDGEQTAVEFLKKTREQRLKALETQSASAKTIDLAGFDLQVALAFREMKRDDKAKVLLQKLNWLRSLAVAN